jgi:hypothetical protein
LPLSFVNFNQSSFSPLIVPHHLPVAGIGKPIS